MRGLPRRWRVCGASILEAVGPATRALVQDIALVEPRFEAGEGIDGGLYRDGLCRRCRRCLAKPFEEAAPVAAGQLAVHVEEGCTAVVADAQALGHRPLEHLATQRRAFQHVHHAQRAGLVAYGRQCLALWQGGDVGFTQVQRQQVAGQGRGLAAFWSLILAQVMFQGGMETVIGLQQAPVSGAVEAWAEEGQARFQCLVAVTGAFAQGEQQGAGGSDGHWSGSAGISPDLE